VRKDLEDLRRGLSNWLPRAFEKKGKKGKKGKGKGDFTDLGGVLPIGTQNDGYSCGICVINAMEYAIFDVPLFKATDRFTLRVHYFLELVAFLLDNVSKPFPEVPVMTLR